jgi:hypothetical protein
MLVFWGMIFCDPTCSKAILLGTKNAPDEKHKKRARLMFEELGNMLFQFERIDGKVKDFPMDEFLHDFFLLPGYNHYWMDEYNIKLDKTPGWILGLRGPMEARYQETILKEVAEVLARAHKSKEKI